MEDLEFYNTVAAVEDEMHFMESDNEPVDTDGYIPEDADSEDAHLWDDEDMDELTPDKPKVSWQEVKAQLNHWGQIFSDGDDSQRIIATERILELFNQVTFSYKDLDFSEHSNKRYQSAVAVIRANFIGETDHPIRFLKRIYPEDLFFNAILFTLGFSPDSDDDSKAKHRGYDASRGAQYVTYFTNVLKYFRSQRRRDLEHEHEKENRARRQAIVTETLNEHDTPESQALRAEHRSQQADALVDLAMLTTDKLQLDKMLPIGDSAENKLQKLKASTLQLFYSFHLVNFSRFAVKPVRDRDDRVLMAAADKGFLTFSTATEAFTFPALIRAPLSAYVLENELYQLLEGRKILQQRVAARYRGIKDSTLSPQFDAAVRYLSRNWRYKDLL